MTAKSFTHALSRLACAMTLAAAVGGAAAQTAPLSYDRQPYRFSSAEFASAGDTALSHVVEAKGALWLRLQFDGVQLQPGSMLRITSFADGAVQHLTARTVKEWRHTSAYFNGDKVLVEMIPAAGSSDNRVGISALMVGKPERQSESQCGATDDRVASNVANRARLIDVGCTANLMAEGCFITAGHCLESASLVDVVEFNVPKSTASGALRHPPPSDQYIPTSTRQFDSGVIGQDWGVFTVHPNSETGLMPIDVQGPGLELATALPAANDTIKIFGYGVDSGKANQTQQRSNGPITTVSASQTRLNYRADTEGGNSGSAVLRGPRVVAIHTHGGCTAGGGANSGTLFTNAQFQSAFAAICSPVRR